MDKATRFIPEYEVVKTEKGYAVFDHVVNKCIIFRFETGNDFHDKSFAESKASKLINAHLSMYTNTEGRF